VGQTSKYQLPFPELGDPPDVPKDVKALAEKTEDVVATVSNKVDSALGDITQIEHAKVTARWPNGGVVSDAARFNFSPAFKSAPTVTCAVDGNAYLSATVTGISATSASVRVADIRNTGRNRGDTCTVHLIAVGKK
jgi:hypothetical protein